MTDPQAVVTSYVYDALNRLTSLTSPQGTSSFAYDALSRRTVLNLPNGTKATYTYDAASQLTELRNTIGLTTISRFAYTYDAVGNRITRTATNGISNYTYDALNRLTQATQPNPVDPLQQITESFTYDPVGNRAASHLATGQLHDAANRLLEDTNATYSYDANGNLIEQISKANGDRTVYTYNVENQLIQVEKFTVAGGLSPVLVAVYRYDPLGRRIGKEVTQAGTTTTTRYVYDNEDILLELDGANVLQARYTHGRGIDEPLVMLRGTQSFFYHADGLGSVWDLTDAAGTSVRSYTYDSFGNLLSTTGTLPNPYTYTARELDSETGLFFYRARYYHPQLGRFLQEDPVAFLGGINFYTYARNDPVIFVDPDGLDIYFLGLGSSAFVGESPNKPGRGIGKQVTVGIAFDTETWTFRTFQSVGVACPSDPSANVTGFNIGLGPVGGVVKGGFQDFFGESREETLVIGPFGRTEITTATGKKGVAVAGGGRGIGLSGTTITTETKPLEPELFRRVVIQRALGEPQRKR